jgi:hypothetical protein
LGEEKAEVAGELEVKVEEEPAKPVEEPETI